MNSRVNYDVNSKIENPYTFLAEIESRPFVLSFKTFFLSGLLAGSSLSVASRSLPSWPNSLAAASVPRHGQPRGGGGERGQQ